MSIIQEALKKIEPGKAVATPRPAPARPAPRVAVELPRFIAPPADKARVRSRAWPLRRAVAAVILAVAIVLAAGVATLIVSRARRPATPAAPAPAASAPEALLPAHQETVYRKMDLPAPIPAVPAVTAAGSAAAQAVRAAPPDLALNGIMYLEGGARALVNNAIVGVGDMIGGATVVAITKKSVILTYNNVEITLLLK